MNYLWVYCFLGYPGDLVVKNSLANAGDARDPVQYLGQEDPLEEEMATHPSTLACRISWTEDPVRLCPWTRKELDTTEHAHMKCHLITTLNLCMGSH